MKLWSHKANTCSCSSCCNVPIISSNPNSNSRRSPMLRMGASVPLLPLHSNGSHEISIFNFVCICCCFSLSSPSSSFPISRHCLNKNTTHTKSYGQLLDIKKKVILQNSLPFLFYPYSKRYFDASRATSILM